MPFYIFSLSCCFFDFLICQYIKKWARYDLKESCITLLFYTIDIWFVLYLREQQDFFGEIGRKIWNIKFGFVVPLNQFVGTHLVIFQSSSLNSVVYYLLLFILVDFAYYWMHRMNHEVGIIWTQHAVHHSTTRFNFLATQRNSFRFTTLNYQQIFFVAPMLFAFSLDEIFFTFAIIQCHQTLIHSEWIPRFWRPLEFVLNSPWHHRIHHSRENQATHGNYGGFFIVFDRLFGTLIEVPDQRFTYGVSGYQVTHNIFKLNFQYFFSLISKIRTSKSYKRSFFITFVPLSLHKHFNTKS